MTLGKGDFMHTQNQFNLVDEPWIPIAGHGLASLSDIFSKPHFKALGGNPIQKISVLKLLLAICQTAATPQDDDEWAQMGAQGMAAKALAYLQEKRDCFWLYGEKPFLQMPAIEKAAEQTFGAILPEISTGNTTVLTQSQVEQNLSDAEKALLLIQVMNFALSGKKTDNSICLSPNYSGKMNDKGKPSTGKSGPALAFMGLLHSYIVGDSLLSTLWLNLASLELVNQSNTVKNGLGFPPWEKMPTGEVCDTAMQLQYSWIGRLTPLSRFLLLKGNTIHYSEGIYYPNYKDGFIESSVAANTSGKEIKVLWSDPKKRPWRSLVSLLSFLNSNQANDFDCQNIRFAIKRARSHENHIDKIGIWNGGLRVSSNAGEQYVSGTDDFVESEIYLPTAYLGESWYHNLKKEMSDLDDLSKNVYGTVLAYFKECNVEGKSHAAQASNLFWQLCEPQFPKLLDACELIEKLPEARQIFANIVTRCYDTHCPKETARQLDAWAKCRPQIGWYLKGESPNSKNSKKAKKAKA